MPPGNLKMKSFKIEEKKYNQKYECAISALAVALYFKDCMVL
jgi:hypothetical protein